MKQIPLKFIFKKNDNDFFFCVSKKNIFAYELINKWPLWHNQISFIYGPQDCGKSLITELWIKKSQAVRIKIDFFEETKFSQNLKNLEKSRCWVLEDIDLLLRLNVKNIEEKILNIFNILINKGDYLLITSKNSPSNLKNNLNDLSSRLKSTMVVEVKEPDETLIKELIQKKLALKQIIISEKNINFLINRIERSYVSVNKIIQLIDQKLMETHSNLSIDFLKKVIEETKL